MEIVRDSNNDASITGIKVKNIVATSKSANEYDVVLPAGSNLSKITSSDVIVTATDSNASVGVATTADNGATWNVTVTAQDGKTSITYVVNVTIASNPIKLNGTPTVGSLNDEKASFSIDFSKISTSILPVNNGSNYYIESHDNGNVLCISNAVNYTEGEDKIAALVKAFDGLTLSNSSLKVSNYKLSVSADNPHILIATAVEYGDRTSEFDTLNLGTTDNLKINLAGFPQIDFVDTTKITPGAKIGNGTAIFSVDSTEIIENSKITANGKVFTIKHEAIPVDPAQIDSSALYMGTSSYTGENIIDKLLEKLSTDETFDVTKVGTGNSAKIQFTEKESKRATCTMDELKALLSYSIN